MTDKDIQYLLLIRKFLEQGTFTLKGVDVVKFVECHLWIKEFMERDSKKAAPKVEPIKKPVAKPLRKKKVK
jgi:hypothetical protein